MHFVVVDDVGKLFRTTTERCTGVSGCHTAADVGGNDVIGAYYSTPDPPCDGLLPDHL